MFQNIFNKIWPHFISIGVLATLYFVLLHRDDYFLNTETESAYILAIIVWSLVLTLLLYPLSKRIAQLSLHTPVIYIFNVIRTHFFSIGVLAALYYGWSHRDDNYLTAETGTGYILGIVGGSLMLTLLLYPVSKRIALLTRLMPIRYWFGTHMILGIVGPVMILFHSNFHMGSTNSNIALFSMLLVAVSGVIGRYIYTNIHHGLYGKRITLKEIKQKTEDDHAELVSLYAKNEILSRHLEKMEEKALRPHAGLMKSLLHVIYMAVNAPLIKRKTLKLLKSSYSENTENETLPDSKVVTRIIKHHTLALRQAAAFRLYERLFSLWHILHLPLFFMMIITAIIHIFAVHMY
jgi:hypothetical protein